MYMSITNTLSKIPYGKFMNRNDYKLMLSKCINNGGGDRIVHVYTSVLLRL